MVLNKPTPGTPTPAGAFIGKPRQRFRLKAASRHMGREDRHRIATSRRHLRSDRYPVTGGRNAFFVLKELDNATKRILALQDLSPLLLLAMLAALHLRGFLLDLKLRILSSQCLEARRDLLDNLLSIAFDCALESGNFRSDRRSLRTLQSLSASLNSTERRFGIAQLSQRICQSIGRVVACRGNSPESRL